MLTVEDNKKFDWKNINLYDCLLGNVMDAIYTERIYEVLLKQIKGTPLEKLYDNVLEPAFNIFTDIELDGMLIDQEKLGVLEKQIQENIDVVKTKILSDPKIIGDINLNSTKQLGSLLYYGEGGYKLCPPDVTEKGEPSVSASTLQILKSIIEIELAKRSNG